MESVKNNPGAELDRPSGQRAIAPKVLRILTRMNIGGPSLQAILLTRDLPALGYRTELAMGACEEADGDMSYLLAAGDPVHWIPRMSRSVQPWSNLLALLSLWRLMRRLRPDIVHTHTAMAGSLGRAAAWLAGVPVIVHTFHGNSLRHYFSPRVSSIFLMIERLLARSSDAICVISRQQFRELSDELRIAPPSRFHVVPLGLDLSRNLAIPLPTLSRPSPSRPIRIGWFGRLVDVKNVRLLIEVVEAASKSSFHFEFHVAGDGPDRKLIQDALSRFGPTFVWYGWKNQIESVIQQCDLLIQTSRNEGTPVALIQGMAAGRAFLSTPAGGVVDMTCGDGRKLSPGATWFDNAVVAEPSPEAFVLALEEFARHPQRLHQMGRSARKAAGSYCKEALVERLDSLYRELLARKIPSRFGLI